MTMNSKTENSQLGRKDFIKLFLRSCTLDASWNYERMQNLAFGFMMAPVIERLYLNKEDRADALQRHLEFMAVTPHISTVIVGVATAMEEENARNDHFDVTSINAVKTGLMGPLAGIGDAFFWGTLKLIAAGIGISLAQQGSILGPIFFLLIINVPAFLARFYGLKLGYQYGSRLFENAQGGALISQITHSATIVGLTTIGAMVASMVNFELPFQVGTGEFAKPIMDYVNEIMPSLFPMLFFLLAFVLLGKKVKTTSLLIGLIVICIVLAYFGIV